MFRQEPGVRRRAKLMSMVKLLCLLLALGVSATAGTYSACGDLQGCAQASPGAQQIVNPTLTPHLAIPWQGGVTYVPLIIPQQRIVPVIAEEPPAPPTAQTPEPGTKLLLLAGVAGLWTWRRRSIQARAEQEESGRAVFKFSRLPVE